MADWDLQRKTEHCDLKLAQKKIEASAMKLERIYSVRDFQLLFNNCLGITHCFKDQVYDHRTQVVVGASVLTDSC
jgi:hypothetical protein